LCLLINGVFHFIQIIMAKKYRSPGVYIKDINSFPNQIASVETAVPAFLGYTEKAMKDEQSLHFIPTRIGSMLDYENWFGGPKPEQGLEIEIIDKYSAGKFQDRSFNVKFPRMEMRSKFLMYYSLKMFFANGGGPCYIISVGDYTENITREKLGTNGGLKVLEKEDEPTLITFPDATGLPTANDFYGLYEDALKQCYERGDRFTIIDTYSEDAGFDSTLRNTLQPDPTFLKFGAAYYPWLQTNIVYMFDESTIKLVHTEIDSFGNLKSPERKPVIPNVDDLLLLPEIKLKLNGFKVVVPPSSAMAGIYALVDNTRGVWKAPANVSLRNVIRPNKTITSQEQEGLNIDPSGKSINAIRTFVGQGTLVWGARTLAGNDNEWRYVSVRRFFNYAEESIKKGTSWAVFEPNDANTWQKVKSQIENFLISQWRSGALAGAKADESFFVKLGLHKTMTLKDILEGRMIVEIGMAVVKPAEFIVLRIQHKMGN